MYLAIIYQHAIEVQLSTIESQLLFLHQGVHEGKQAETANSPSQGLTDYRVSLIASDRLVFRPEHKPLEPDASFAFGRMCSREQCCQRGPIGISD